MLRSLLLYRFLIFNSLLVSMMGGILWLGAGPYLMQGSLIYQLCMAPIVTLFAVGWCYSFREIWVAARQLDSIKGSRWVPPASPEEADLDLEKVEWLDAIVEWLVMLGLLGTVIGISVAISGINMATSSSAQGAKSATVALVEGMRIAMNTTILGGVLGLWQSMNYRMLRTALIAYWSRRTSAGRD